MKLPRSVRDADVAGKVVLVRADLNVPLENGKVADDARIRASLPTLQLLLDGGASEVRVCSHLGRPKGEEDRAKYAIEPVRAHLAELLPDARITVLENTRFDPGETANDPGFAARLAAGCDLYVNDAFGSAHRAHASTEAVAHLLPAYAGLLLLAELEHLGRLLGEVDRPFVIVAGGAKVDDKVGVLKNLGARADRVLIGGKMAEDVRAENPFPFPVLLPSDIVAAESFAADAPLRDSPPTTTRPLAGSGSTSGPSPARSSPLRSRTREPCSGTGRWASSSGPGSPRGRSRSPARSPPAPASPSSAAATRCVPSTRPASPTASRGSRPAAARHSSCSRASSSRASRRSRPHNPLVLIAGNWKMFKGPGEAGAYCRALRDADLGSVEVVVCPPYVSLGEAVQALAGTEIGVAAQNVHWASEGAFTGEISAPMLRELGVYGAIVGHSERRQFFGETDETVVRRTVAAIEQGLHVIACVGETEAEREAGETEAVLRRQVGAIAAGVAETDELVIAYEPVWAIGTGKTATPELAQEAHAFVKTILDVPVLYGGSVKPENAAALAAQPDVDGALVGGASLDVESFAAICREASHS